VQNFFQDLGENTSSCSNTLLYHLFAVQHCKVKSTSAITGPAKLCGLGFVLLTNSKQKFIVSFYVFPMLMKQTFGNQCSRYWYGTS